MVKYRFGYYWHTVFNPFQKEIGGLYTSAFDITTFVNVEAN